MSILTQQAIQAILFDMDGTLIDSEINTEKAVVKLLQEEGQQAPDLDLTQFYGITWQSIADLLLKEVPGLKLDSQTIQSRLQADFHHRFVHEAPAYIPGALEFYQSAGRVLKTGIASSSNRESIEHIIDRMQVADITDFIIGAEDYSNSKPAPDCYLLAASRLGLEPGACLVFEDSIPGIQAARNAGMACVGVIFRSADPEQARKLADLCIKDYYELPAGFLNKIQQA